MELVTLLDDHWQEWVVACMFERHQDAEGFERLFLGLRILSHLVISRFMSKHVV